MATLSDLVSGDDVVAEGKSKEVSEATVAEKTEKAKRQHPLRCSVCLDDFKDPKVLPCCHTFCRGCLERILVKSKEKKKLTCPQYRLQHAVPETGPGGFLTDFTIAHELEKPAITSKPATCEQCETSDKAIAYCCDCETHLCEFCSGAHERLKLWKDHKVLPLESLSSDQERVRSGKPVSLYCSSHPTEPLKVYCKTCEALVCCECLVAKHQAHKLGTIDKDTQKEVQSQLKSLADKVHQQKLPGFENSLEHIKKVEKTLVARPGDLKSAINTTFDTLSAALESRRKQLLSEAESKCNGDLKKVWVQKEQVETTITALKSTLSFAERALQCSSDVELLSLSSQALSRLRELSKAKWDPSSIYEIEGMGLKFVQGNHTAYLQRIGKLEEIPLAPNDIVVQNFPATIPLGKKITFQVVGRFQKSMKRISAQCTLKPENLHISVEYGGQSKKQMTLRACAEVGGTCTVPFTPICGGPHKLSVSLNATGSPRKHYEFNSNVVGTPSKGARVCRGPDWEYGDMVVGGGELGTVSNSNCQHIPGYSISVTWDNGKAYTHRWGDNMCYDVQLALAQQK